MSRPPVIDARGITRHYGPVAALVGVTLRVEASEAVLLLGPNGAGKSTLLGIVSGLVRPTSGTVSLFGEPFHGDAPHLRRRLGLLSHQTFLYEHLTALENLEFYARLYGLARPGETARQALAAVGLADRGDEQVRGFSRGMQQRLAIARARLHRPALLLFDEPFTGLDRDSTMSLQGALREVRNDGRTCLIATHSFAAGLAVATRAVILAAGAIAFDGRTADLDVAALEDHYRRAIEAPGTAAS